MDLGSLSTVKQGRSGIAKYGPSTRHHFRSIGRCMNRWREPGFENIDQRPRGQHRDVSRHMTCSVLIAFETPEKMSPPPDKHNITAVQEHCAVRQAFDRRFKSDLLLLAVDAGGVKRLVDCLRQRSACLGLAMRLAPCARKFPVSLSPAFATRAVSCRKSRRFIQKEQFSIFPRCHDRPLSVFEAENACHPILMRVGFLDDPVVIMKDSPVAHQGTSGGVGVKGAEGIDSVL